MQLMPAKARGVSRALEVSYGIDKLTDADFNMRLGRAYFSGLLKDFNGS